jgi:NADH:ubiquinone oxidoreductase subunit 4 (subunit M)
LGNTILINENYNEDYLIKFYGYNEKYGLIFEWLDSFIYNEFLTYIIIGSVVICAIYSLWLSNRILFGNLGNFFTHASDLNKAEFTIIFSLFFFILICGIFPYFLMDYIKIIVWLILSRGYSPIMV